MKRPPFEKISFALATVAALASAGWFGFGAEASRPPRKGASNRSSPVVNYLAEDERGESDKTPEWTAPQPSSRGPDWLYEVFAPPEITRDPGSGEWVVAAKHSPHAFEVEPKDEGVQLVSIERELFPLQFLGCVRWDGTWIGSFEDIRSRTTRVGRAGSVLPDLDLLIEEIAPSPKSNQEIEARAVDARIFARVRDRRTGATTQLEAGKRSFTNQWAAVVAIKSADETLAHRLRVGESVEFSGSTYTMVQLDPVAAGVVIKVTDAESGMIQELKLSMGDPSSAAPAQIVQ